ncbi:MAG: ABC transporter substrate-binding protein [Chloroflexi bacterium]|nr:ABC transporter substrate-binding protein [Chloroflexota bacterium]
MSIEDPYEKDREKTKGEAMHSIIRAHANVLCLTIIMAFIFACATPPQPASQPAPAEKRAEPAKSAPEKVAKPPSGPISLVHSFRGVAATFDPAIIDQARELVFVKNVYEGLVETVPGGVDIRPLLAREWAISPDRTGYTFKLRDDVVFHNGSPFDAEAAKVSYDRIKGINKGRAFLMDHIKDYVVKDKFTFEITLKRPYPYFLEVVSRLLISSPRALADNKTASDPWATQWFGVNVAGTGPYKVGSFVKDSRIDLVKHDKYYRTWEPGTPDRVILLSNPDAQTALMLMQRGEVDMIAGVSTDLAEQAAKIPGIKILQQRPLSMQAITFNTARKPLDDVRVRRAIQLAYDYDADVAFFKGFINQSRGPLPDGFPGADPSLPLFKRDLNKAKQLLAEAGYPNGGFAITYLGQKDTSWVEFRGTNLQESLRPLGIEVKQVLVPWPQVVQMMNKLETSADMAIRIRAPLLGDPSSLLRDSFHSDAIGANNWTFYRDPELDAMIDRVVTIADDSERTQLLYQIQRRIGDQALALFVGVPLYTDPVREKVENVVYEFLDGVLPVRFFYVRVKS